MTSKINLHIVAGWIMIFWIVLIYALNSADDAAAALRVIVLTYAILTLSCLVIFIYELWKSNIK